VSAASGPTGPAFITEAVAAGMTFEDAVALDVALTHAEQAIDPHIKRGDLSTANALADAFEATILSQFGATFPALAS
jgi:hypothetical protein